MIRGTGRGEKTVAWRSVGFVVGLIGGAAIAVSGCGLAGFDNGGSEPIAEVAGDDDQLRSSEIDGQLSDSVSASASSAADAAGVDSDQLLTRSQLSQGQDESGPDETEPDGDADGATSGVGDASEPTSTTERASSSTTERDTTSSSTTTTTESTTSSATSTTERTTTTKRTTTTRPTTTTRQTTTTRRTTTNPPTTQRTTTTTTTTTSPSTTTTKPPDPLAMTYGAVGTEIKGDVTAAGIPIPDVTVDLYEAVTANERGPFLGDTTSGADGTWTLGQMDPSCYIIVGVAPEGRVFIGGSRFKQRYVCNNT